MVAKNWCYFITYALSLLVGAQTALRTRALQTAVTWDKYSLSIHNERVFVFSGEFHYYRLPSPDLWKDVLEKMKAAGFNAASVYFSWGYHSPKSGEYDFTGIRDVQKLFDIANEVGIYIISRAGPYINAEVDSGGFPGWLTTTKDLTRVYSPEYTAAWTEWLSAIDPYIAKNQITNKGPVILNQVGKFIFNMCPSYMQALEDKFRADGVIVPLTFNDAWTNSSFGHGVGAVDIYGFDSYPQGFDCANPNIWPGSAQTYWRGYHESFNPTEPLYIPEFQGGAFDPWGGVGYEKCATLINYQFERVFYKNNYAQGVTMLNLYMTYGGTNWGNIGYPGVYTSYDYAGGISESRQLPYKYGELKLQGHFTQTVKPFSTTFWFNGSTADNSDIRVDTLQDVYTGTQFYIVRHQNSSSLVHDTFHLNVNSTDGTFTIPQQASTAITLDGRDSKIIVTGYDFGSHHLVYSTNEIFTHAQIGKRNVALLYAFEGEDGETALKVNRSAKPAVKSFGNNPVTTCVNGTTLRLNYKHQGITPVVITGAAEPDLLLYLTGYDDAIKFWAPKVDDKQTVLVYGPYLVRGASLKGTTLALRGDTNATTTIEIVAPETVKTVTWNGEKISVQTTLYGTLVGKLAGPAKITVPNLLKAKWKFNWASPETDPNFDDSNWIVANHSTTNSITQPETLPVLYADDYGYHTGSIWFRGKFNGPSAITGLELLGQGGNGSGYLAWLNGEYLGGTPIPATSSSANATYTFSKGQVKSGENTISLLLLTSGHDEDWNVDDQFKSARGFGKALLVGGNNTAIKWKVQGNLGGEDIVDKVRGPYNEGGLYGERAGWHLPGFSDSKWQSVSLPYNFKQPGVAWFRTTFNLNIPSGHDVPLAFRFTDDKSKEYRAIFYVNGWQFGKYANALGPQTVFPVPEGIIKHNGQNTVAIGVISFNANSSELANFNIEILGAYCGGIKVNDVDSPNYNKAVRRV
ncbi:beta galactosidase [Jimgerdemannia flammicorona]|uniref:beta-galactosidase n=1 Tax=Jimgerdemannia flammicorona TaxID=994334 RepID=A0A433DN49_9FUNG|nr:beta galactosidase [Jimgerdemannia flammicorona]